MPTKLFTRVLLPCLLVTCLFLFNHFFPGNPASGLVKGALWGIFTAISVLLLGAVVFWKNRFHKKKVRTAEPTETTSRAAISVFIIDSLARFDTWLWWVLVFGAVALYSPQLFQSPNLTWLPLFAWALAILLLGAGKSSAESSSKNEKGEKSHRTLNGASKLFKRVAVLSTIGVIAYYALFAPDGTWEKASGVRNSSAMQGQSNMNIPEGIPLNPTFTSRKLEGWTATYVAANIHYRVPQSRWRGMRLPLDAKPAREITEVIDLTVSFGAGNEALDIRLSGSCRAVTDKRRNAVSKTCAGDWKDRGSQISGKFYLEIKEASGEQRYFDAYLYDGNNIPRKSELAMFLSGAPIPHIMLQFRPKEWTMENQ